MCQTSDLRVKVCSRQDALLNTATSRSLLTVWNWICMWKIVARWLFEVTNSLSNLWLYEGMNGSQFTQDGRTIKNRDQTGQDSVLSTQYVSSNKCELSSPLTVSQVHVVISLPLHPSGFRASWETRYISLTVTCKVHRSDVWCTLPTRDLGLVRLSDLAMVLRGWIDDQ